MEAANQKNIGKYNNEFEIKQIHITFLQEP